jgi:SAM-dependent methyltransferase
MDVRHQQTLDCLLEATAAAEDRHFWFRGFRRFVLPLVARAAAGLNRPRVLDCGCGTGGMLPHLAAHGWTVGLDASAVGLAIARRNGPVSLVRSLAGSLPFSGASFDIVTCFDVLYSLDAAEEAHAVSEIFRVLVSGGALIVTVAALPVLSGDHSAFSAERRRYRRRDLEGLLQTAGFRIDRLTYTNATLVPALLARRTLQRRRGSRAVGSDLAVPRAPVNALLAAMLAAEAALARHVDLPIGSSLLALARKPLSVPAAHR